MPSEDYMDRDDIIDADEDHGLVDDIVDEDTDLDDAEDTDDADDDTVTFASLGLPEEILEAVTGYGFPRPHPIQAAAIPPLLELRDVVGFHTLS